MADIEKSLEERRKRIETISAPEEMETRIRKALENAQPVKKKPAWKPWLLSAAALFFLVLISSQYNALAFYGKKLLGFDEIMDAPIAELNEKGMGQPIGKTVTLKGGSKLTIDGILSDDNQLMLFYTVTNQNGIDWDNGDPFSPTTISGFRTKSHIESGTSTTTENGTLQKGQFSFEPVNPFAKKLTLSFFEREGGVERTITFPYEPNRAMRAGVQQRIGKTLMVDGGKVRFDSITATPTMTIVKGRASVENLDRVSDPFGGIDLVVDGEPLASTGGGTTSTISGGVKFEVRYHPLPDGVNSLKLDMRAFAGYRKLDAKEAVDKMSTIPIGGKRLFITGMNQNGDDLDMTIRTEEDVMLDKVVLLTKAGEVPLKTTKRMDYVTDESGEIWKERVISFKTKDEPTHLMIGGMHYMKTYHQTVDIPLRK